MCGFSKRHFLGLQQPPPLAQSPLFLSHRLWGFTFLALESWAGGPGRGLGFLTPEISLLNFYPLHVDVGPAHSASVPLLPVWMDVVSLIP